MHCTEEDMLLCQQASGKEYVLSKLIVTQYGRASLKDRYDVCILSDEEAGLDLGQLGRNRCPIQVIYKYAFLSP